MKGNPIWWKEFITEYLKNGQKGGPAYKKIFPKVKPNTADTNSWKLMRNEEFNKELEKAKSEAVKIIEMSRNEWIEGLKGIAKDPKIKLNAGAKLKAYELLGKASGYLTDKVEVSGTVDLATRIIQARRKTVE